MHVLQELQELRGMRLPFDLFSSSSKLCPFQPSLLLTVFLINALSAPLGDMFTLKALFPRAETTREGCALQITFMLTDDSGAEVTSFTPGGVYNLTIPSYDNPLMRANAWVHSSMGTLDTADECACTFTQARARWPLLPTFPSRVFLEKCRRCLRSPLA
jgi:hypothetical protein